MQEKHRRMNEVPDSYFTILKPGTDEIVSKKSRFIGYAQPIHTEEEAIAYIESIKKKHYDARHNCYAFAIGASQPLYRFSDDGEPQGTAGKPILEVITGSHTTNLCIVVTRYFGGTLLGTGGLVRAYTEAAKSALSAAGIREMVQMQLLDICCSYNDSGKIQYILSTNDIRIMDTRYSEQVIFHTAVPVPDVAGLKHMLTEATAARATFIENDVQFMAV